MSAPCRAHKKSRRLEGRRLRVSGSRNDAPMLAGEVGVGRHRSRRCEVEVTLERQPEGAAGAPELQQAHVAEFGLAETDVDHIISTGSVRQ